MKSIGARLAVWYAAAATLTFAALSVAGYYLLMGYLVQGLDLLNSTVYRQVEERLGPRHADLDARALNARIREMTESASALFYVEIEVHAGGPLYRSRNLRDQSIPNVGGGGQYDVMVPEVGLLRAAEFELGNLKVRVATPMRPVREVMKGYIEVCVALLVLMLIASAALGFAFSHVALRPIRVIQETANRIGFRNLSERVPVSEVRDEVSDLARLLNQMFDRLESAFDQVRRFTADASHELKTPLSIMRLQAEKVLVSGELSHTIEEFVHSQIEEIARLNAIIDELLFLSRAEAQAISMERLALDPGEFLVGFSQDARVLAEHGGVRFEDRHEGRGLVAFDPKWLRQVLLNLLTNALKASPPGGQVSLRSTLSASSWRVSIEDEGPGVPDNMRSHIFDRFVRLDPATESQRTGTGLGLAICRGIVELHQGRIFAEAGVGGHGLRVVFELPAAAT